MQSRVVITGIGVVTSVGTGREQFWESMLAGRCGVSAVESFGTGGYNVHRQGLNVLFADNHVAVFKKFEPQELSYSPDGHATWEDLKRPNDP